MSMAEVGMQSGAGSVAEWFNDNKAKHQVFFNKAKRELLCGGFAGCIAKTCTAPFTRLTVLAQTSSLLARRAAGEVARPVGLMQVLRQLTAERGIGVLWRGNVLTCIHRFPYTGFNFCIHEAFWRTYHDELNRLPGGKLIPGAVAGVASVTLCYPLEVVRTRTMATHEGGVFSIARNMVCTEGPRSMYRGVGTAMCVTIPSLSISFGVYKQFNDKFSSTYPTLSPLLCGGVSGLAGSTLTFPMDVLRKRLQVMGMDPTLPKRTAFAEAQVLWSQEGARGFWRGVTPELCKVFPTVALTFWSFEWLRQHMA